MARLPEPGGDDGSWGGILNDFLLVAHNPDGTLRADTTPSYEIPDGSVTPVKLSQAYIPMSQKGTPQGVASLDDTGKVSSSQLPDLSSTAARTQTFTSSGPLMTEQGGHRLYNDTGKDWTILSVRSSVGVPSTGSAIIVDIDIDGTTIFTNQSKRPSIAANEPTSGRVTDIDVVTVKDGQYITVDVDQVGAATPGSDLVVQMEVR